MTAEYSKRTGILRIKLSGEFDHIAARGINIISDVNIRKYKPKKLIYDFGGISFADSSAIAVIMGRYRVMEQIGKRSKIGIENADPTVMKIFSFSGLEKYIERI